MTVPGEPQHTEYQQTPYGAPPPAYGAPPQYGGPYGAPPRSDDGVWAILAHLSLFALAVIGPLVIYLVIKDTSPFARHHAAEALNFQLTLMIATIATFPLVLVLIGIPLLLGYWLAAVVLALVATLAAGRREAYRYPLTIRFVS